MKQKNQTKSDASICHEVQIHYKRPLFDAERNIKSSIDMEAILRDFIDAKRIDHKEFFWIVLLSNANQVLGLSEIGVGSSNVVAINIKEICQLALLANATRVIACHNHTSGRLVPSEADRQLTKKLTKALKLLDIELLDHLIITSEGYASFVDNDWM